MFGIGKKETEKAVTKKAEKGASDEIEFDFEEDDKLPFDEEDFSDENFADEDFAAEPERKLRQALSQRTLLLGLLLLLALGGGGYYYLNSTPAPPPPQPAPVKAKVKVQPATPAQPVASAPVAAVTPASAAPAAKVVPAASAPEAKSEALTPPSRQPFTLSAGAFLSQKHQREVEKKIRRLGYTPKVETTFSMVPMTRLRLGVYDPATAQTRSRELSAQLPGLFAMKQGDKVALYAGSYQSLDQARSFADQLYLRGILVDEETVSLRMPLKKISFGSFASRTAAEKAAKRAVAAGLTAQVIKR